MRQFKLWFLTTTNYQLPTCLLIESEPEGSSLRVERPAGKTARRAFTLIELLVVCAIIGVLATVVILNLMSAKATSRYTATLADMTTITKAVNVYKATHNNAWPDAWSGASDADDPPYTFCNNDGSCTNDFLVEMFGGKIPVPPCIGASYAYYVRPSSMDRTGGYIAAIYFTPLSPWKTASLDAGGGVPALSAVAGRECINIRDKVTKQITCKENNTDFGN